jgi:hypothetical protein
MPLCVLGLSDIYKYIWGKVSKNVNKSYSDLILKDSVFDGHSIYINVTQGAIIVDATSVIQSDGQSNGGEGRTIGFGGSYGGIGGNCNTLRFEVNPTYGKFDQEFLFEYFEVRLQYNHF